MKGKARYQLHIGTASIMLVFMTLCLVSFAVLSLVNANADHKLSVRKSMRTRSYYEAVAMAEVWLSELDPELRAYAADGEEAFDSRIRDEYGGDLITAVFPLEGAEVQTLQVVVRPVFHGDATVKKPFYEVLSYSVVTDEESLDYDETLNVSPAPSAGR